METKKRVTTPEFRVSFPHLFKPNTAPGSEVAKYSVVMLFDKKTDITALKKLAQAAVMERWPDQATRPKNLRSPFRDGDKEKEGVEGYKNVTFVTASGLRPPGVVDKNVQPIVDTKEVYPGCYGKAGIVAYAYDKAGNRGVAFGLQNFQKTRDGEVLGGGTAKPEDDFGPVQEDDGEYAGTTASKTSAEDFFS